MATTFLFKSPGCSETGESFERNIDVILGFRLEVVPSLLETSARFLRKSGVSIPPDEVEH